MKLGHFCLFLSVSVHFCHFMSVSVSFCPFLMNFVGFSLFLSISVVFSLFMSGGREKGVLGEGEFIHLQNVFLEQPRLKWVCCGTRQVITKNM